MATIREGMVGKAVVRLVQTPHGYAGAVFENGQRKFLEEGSDPDGLWMRAQDAAARLNPLFVGYEGARKRFLGFFPDGFRGADYSGHERAYKLNAKAKLDQAAPLEQAAVGTGFGDAVLAAYQATNLLSVFEKAKLKPVLKGPDADSFIQAAASFAGGNLKDGLRDLKSLLKPHDSAKWTVVTYLPFLWRPADHFFLKPTMICSFAARVGHRFADVYSADLDASIYESLLDLAAETREKIADMRPHDMIDIQSFMWTSVEYTEDDRADYE